MDIMFEQGSECQKIFKSSISGVTLTDTDDRFNTSAHAWHRRWICYSWCNAVSNSGLDDVFDVLVDPEYYVLNWIEVGVSCRSRNGSDCISL